MPVLTIGIVRDCFFSTLRLLLINCHATNLECKDRERQRKRESRRQAREPRREKEQQRIRVRDIKKGDIVCWKDNMKNM